MSQDPGTIRVKNQLVIARRARRTVQYAWIVIDYRTDFLKVLLFKINFVTVLILLGARLYRKFFVGVKCLNKGRK